MANETSMHLFEDILIDENAVPTMLPISLLKTITKDFSYDLKIGKGAFAVVYKGLLPNGLTIAVKKLSSSFEMDNKIFQRQVTCLMSMKHKNIVRFLGYCADTRGEILDYGGKYIMVDQTTRFLCFQYLPKGSLQKYITDASCGLKWRIRYQIIKGICEGLQHLHANHIIHFDLKPANVLFDNKMVPKITDFGLSLCFDAERESRVVTMKLTGSQGYVAPEQYDGVRSQKLDIYSLGVIIREIMTGIQGYSEVEDVVESWRCRLNTSSEETLLEQIRVCAKLGIECTDPNLGKRPKIQHIVKMLEETETMHTFIQTEMCTTSATPLQVPQRLSELHVLQRLQELSVGEDSKSRMDDIYRELNTLERTVHGVQKPSNLKLSLLQIITDNFSDELKIGSGGCGVVYKGILRNGIIAVKKLFNSHTVEDKMFHQEVKSLMMVQHQNTVRFLGYCSHTEEQARDMAGKIILAEIRERLLCLEYVGNGCLEDHITVASVLHLRPLQMS